MNNVILADKKIYSNPILIFYGIFFAYMPYPAFGYLSVHVCVRLRQKNQKRISIFMNPSANILNKMLDFSIKISHFCESLKSVNGHC